MQLSDDRNVLYVFSVQVIRLTQQHSGFAYARPSGAVIYPPRATTLRGRVIGAQSQTTTFTPPIHEPTNTPTSRCILQAPPTRPGEQPCTSRLVFFRSGSAIGPSVV